MKKIDLHIHTKTTISDSDFEFSIEKLQEYVTMLKIDCIAITNHNIFDLLQYTEICRVLRNVVLPGIEINLEGGHLLLISDLNDLDGFTAKCLKVQMRIRSKDEFISIEEFREIFGDLSKYLLIPHYEKKPNIPDRIIRQLSEYITAGEVTSIRKFKSCVKESDKLVPVIFSDQRFYDGMKPFSQRQTFIDLDTISLQGIKSCLFDKHKVYLSEDDGNEIFQVTESGLRLSSGLNVIIGERSSGKTHTLNIIQEAFDNVKYIKQFSLLQNDEDKFEEMNKVREASFAETFLKEFKDVVEDVRSINLKLDDDNIENYLSTLKKFAFENDKQDSFSKAVLFSESQFTDVKQDSLKRLIDSTVLLIDNIEFRPIINKHISIYDLKNLAVELMIKYSHTEELNLKKRWLNDLISNIKSELRFRTSSTPPDEIDFYSILMNKKKIDLADKIVGHLRNEREIDRKEIRNFKIVVRTKNFTGAQQLKDKRRRRESFSAAFGNYSKFYDYLQSLKAIETLESTEYYRFFVNIEYKTLNKHDFPVSGGERSEFNLLREINDALKHDLLLIDEPESSFDNLFLKNEVNLLIKEISKEIPVIVVTHNSTVGASIKPDYILYTHKDIQPDEIIYKVYTGYPSNKELKTSTGETILNYDIMLNCLEAGNDAYIERKIKNYEILKN